MSKQILIGYATREGDGAAKIIAGVDTDYAAQQKILTAADRDHVFPAGIQRIERCNLEVVATSIFISDDVAAHLKQRREEEASLLKTRAAKITAQSAQQKAIADTRSALNKAVIARNIALGDKLKAEVKLRNLIATPETLQSNNHKSLVEKANAELEAVKAKVEKAVAEYQAAFEAHDQAKLGTIVSEKPAEPNPETKPEPAAEPAPEKKGLFTKIKDAVTG